MNSSRHVNNWNVLNAVSTLSETKYGCRGGPEVQKSVNQFIVGQLEPWRIDSVT